jgi:hypothetical protein
VPTDKIALIDTASILRAGFPWWTPSDDDLASIEPGHTNVKVRALSLEEDGGGDPWQALTVWVAVHDRSGDILRGPIVGGALEHDGYRDGDVLDVQIGRVFEVVHIAASGEPIFSPDRARSLLGKRVLVGITSIAPSGAVIEQFQIVGTVEAYDPTSVIRLSLSNGENYDLPPDLRPFEEAQPGEYRLRSTGELVIDPDFICNWTSRLSSDDSLPRNGFEPNKRWKRRRRR